MPLIYEELVKENREAFVKKVKSIADDLGIPPNWLMIIMKSESGFSPKITNGIGCVGLIQFCGSTQRQLGVTGDQLRAMSNVEQLDYVWKFYLYWHRVHRPYRDFTDLYLVAFYPKAHLESYPDNQVLPQNVYDLNKVFDVDKDGKLTVGNFRTYIRNKYAHVADQIEPIPAWKLLIKPLIIGFILLLVADYMIFHFIDWKAIHNKTQDLAKNLNSSVGFFKK